MNGYQILPMISPQNRPSWLGGPFMDKATELLHTSMAQVMANVKGLATHVTSQSEKEGKQSEKMDQILTRIERIETWLSELEANGEGTAHDRRMGGSLRSIISEHPSLKVCLETVSLVLSVKDISL
jgi:hypothetical protein